MSGVKHLAVLSTGDRVANPAPLAAVGRKLRRRNRHLARAIADSGMGQVRRLLGYKTVWAGGRLIEADTFFPSSNLLKLWDGESQTVPSRAGVRLRGMRA
jgi:hypothetical protein